MGCNWGDVRESVDRRKKRVGNDGGEDMFKQAGIAAE